MSAHTAPTGTTSTTSTTSTPPAAGTSSPARRTGTRRLSGLTRRVAAAVVVLGASSTLLSLPTAQAADPTKQAHSFFGAKVCAAGRCVGSAQAHLWYDSRDRAGLQPTRVQYNWASPELPAGTWMDFDAFDKAGRQVWHNQGAATGSRGTLRGARAVTFAAGSRLPAGTVCGTLFRSWHQSVQMLNRTCVTIG